VSAEEVPPDTPLSEFTEDGVLKEG